MLSDQIQDWLTRNGPFKEGYEFYRATGDNRDLAFFTTALKKKYLPPGAKDKLKQHLGDYLLRNPPLPSSARSIQQKVVTVPSAPVTEPPAILSLRARGRHLLKQQSHLRARLVTMSETPDKYTDEERYEVAHELMSKVIANIDDVYDKIRRWSEHGELPVAATTSSVIQETVAKMQRIPALRSKVSRHRRALKNPLPKDEKERLEKEIGEAEAEVLQLQTELGLTD